MTCHCQSHVVINHQNLILHTCICNTVIHAFLGDFQDAQSQSASKSFPVALNRSGNGELQSQLQMLQDVF